MKIHVNAFFEAHSKEAIINCNVSGRVISPTIYHGIEHVTISELETSPSVTSKQERVSEGT